MEGHGETCAACGDGLAPGARFCSSCGTPAAPPACSSCQQPLLAGARFCSACGTPVGGATVPTPASPQPVAERRITSVLFGDLVGFTTLSESRDAEEVRELLSGYFSQCRTVIGRYGGTVEKFIGDAVMAVWGVPVAHEDDAERAVRAGLELVEMVATLGERLGVPGLAMRVGVVTGEVAVTVGATNEGMVAGDAVNTASRVQSAARPGEVWVDEATRSLTAAAIAYEDAGEHELKGKAAPMRLHAARAVVGAVGGGRRVDGLEAPHTGRDRDLRLLKELFHGVQEARRPRLLVIDGEPGVGKSRLIWEFEKYVDGLTELTRWHRGRCLSYGDGVAFWALTEAVRARLGLTETETGDVVSERLDEGLERFVTDPAEREWLRPRLAGLVGVAQAPAGFERDDLFAAWTTFFERVCDGATSVVLVIDDAHHADAGLLDFLDHLMASARFPVLVVVLARPELLARRHDLGGRRATVMRLEPLEDDAMRSLVDGLVEGLPAGVRDDLVQRAEGIPLFAVETVRALIDRDAVVPRGGRYVPAEGVELSLETLGAPASLQALVAARLDALSADERRVVADAAVLGTSFTREGIEALAGIDGVDVILSSLQRKEILTVQTDRLSSERGQLKFVQTVVRQVAYSTQSRRDRKHRHVTAARFLEGQLDESEDLAVVIAQHLLDAVDASAGGDEDVRELTARAVAMLERAATRSAALGAPDEALRLVQTALSRTTDDATRARLALQGARSAYDRGQHATAIDLAGQATELFDRLAMLPEAAGAVAVQARAYGGTGENATAIEIAQERWSQVVDVRGTEAARLQLATVLAWSHMSRGEFDAFAEWNDHRVRLAEALVDRRALAHAYMHVGLRFSNMGAPRTAMALWGIAADIAREQSTPERLAHALGNMASLEVNRDPVQALAYLDDAVDAARRSGSFEWIDFTRMNRLIVLWVSGDHERAHREMLDLVETATDPQIRAFMPAVGMLVAGATGKPLDVVVDEGAEQQDDIHARIWLKMRQAMLAAEAGRRDDVAGLAEDIVTTYRAHYGFDNDFPVVWAESVDRVLRVGAVDAAARLLEPIENAMPGSVPPAVSAHLPHLRGRVRAVQGEPADVVEADLRGGVAALTTFGARGYAGRAVEHLGDWLVSQDRLVEADEAYDDAVRRYESADALGWARSLQERRSVARVPSA